nr:MAG TPA: hypothetical protein [Caudoviricetes sp.]
MFCSSSLWNNLSPPTKAVQAHRTIILLNWYVCINEK